MLSTSHDEQFTEFVSVRLPALRRVAYLLCQDWHQADDLVQVAITRLYVHWGRVSGMEHADAYLRTILARAFLSERRSGWFRRVVLNDQVPESVTYWPAPDRDSALDLKAALADLPARQRATLVLRFYCDMTIEQTAEALGCTQGTVKSQTSKGLSSLRHALEPGESEEVTAHG